MRTTIRGESHFTYKLKLKSEVDVKVTQQLVFIANGKAVTDSLVVATVFEKSHDHVIRDIRQQIAKLNEAGEGEWSATNFGETYYQHEQNKQFYPKFNLTEDAFAIVAMSYVTATAMRMKIRFIEEFKRMREQIASQSKALVIPSYQIEDRVARAKQWIAEEEERQMLLLETQRQEELLALHAPKISYYDQILRSDDAMNVTQIAKDYGMGPATLNRILCEAGVQYKTNGQWVLTSRYAKLGYTKSETVGYSEKNSRVYTKWTQKGRLFIHELLTERGITPNPEKKQRRNGKKRKEAPIALLASGTEGRGHHKITLNIRLER